MALFAWLVLEAGAGVVWEENIVGWLVLEAAAGVVWEENIAGWLEAAGAEQDLCMLLLSYIVTFCIS